MRLMMTALTALTALTVTLWNSGLVAGALVCDCLYVKGNGLWIASGCTVARQVLEDPLGISFPHYSPDGRQVAYVNETSADPNQLPRLVIADAASGSLLKVVPLNAPDINAVLQLGWLSQDKLWIVGHNNPSAGVYYEINVESGKLSTGIPGARFAPSPNGKHMVQDEFVPHGAPPPHDSSVALLDGDRIYPPQGDRSYHRFEQRYSWSSDSSRVAFIDSRPDLSLRSIVIISAQEGDDDRKVASFQLPASVEPERIAWTDQGSIAIASGDHYYLYDPKAGTLTIVVQQPAALQTLVVKDVNGTFPVVDRHCRASAGE